MLNPGNTRDTGSGLTLLELLLVLSLMSILLLLSLPGFQSLVDKSKGSAALASIASAIALAKSTAINEQQPVTICPSNNGNQCTGNWHEGFLVFVDRDGDRQPDIDDRILRSAAYNNLPGTIQWRVFGNRRSVLINHFGYLENQSGNFTWCPASGNAENAAQLIVNRVGRVRKAIDFDGDGIVEDSRGRPLRCH